ncbi:Transcriptional activator protein LasR [compost metagenome]|jgi:DNA-binding CsgD family transcriptional regulator|nr:helix-turn-helix domain-containing protein [Achromobacter sp. Root83]
MSVNPPADPPVNPLRPQPARSLLAACGGAPPPGKPLSDRQTACLHWSAAGKTSWETSRILGVSESTVNFHLRNACAKLGVRGRRAAVVAALRLGLLDTLKA